MPSAPLAAVVLPQLPSPLIRRVSPPPLLQPLFVSDTHGGYYKHDSGLQWFVCLVMAVSVAVRAVGFEQLLPAWAEGDSWTSVVAGT